MKNFSTSPAPCAQSAASGEERQCEDIRSAGSEAQSSERRGSSEQLGVTARRDGTVCEGCGCDIDPEYCWCGDAIPGHSWSTGHGPVPMGCVCGYSSQGESE